MKVGFVGVGNIGFPMARNIAEGGFSLIAFDVSPEPLRQLAERGARAAVSPAEVGRDCEIIGLCVRDDAQVEQALLGDGGLLAAAKPGAIIAIHSTIRPRTVVRLAAIAAERGVHVLDVAITGGAYRAEAKTLCYMAGGDAALIDRCRPVFQTSAASIVPTGALGSGMATKLCNNLVTYLQFLATFEALHLAKRAGVSQDVLTAVTQANGVMTPPMLGYLGLWQSLAAGAPTDALRDELEKFANLAEKDLAITLEFARDLGVSLPGTGLCSQLMAAVFGLKERRARG